MARKFLTPIDLSQLELLRARIHNAATIADGSGVEGQIYWNTSTDRLMLHNGTVFVACLFAPITSADIADGTIVNIDVNAAAAIARSKLDFGAGLVNADLAAGAAIALSKLAIDPLARANHTGTQLASTISNFDTQVRTNPMNLLVAPTADVAFNAKKITGLAEPSSPQDGATKNYVDNAIQGLDALQSVRVASTATVTISAPGAAIDGVTLAANDRVLLKNQSAPAENGVYAFTGAATPMTRTVDADIWLDLVSAYVWVEAGTVNQDTGWVSTVDQGGTLGTTAVTWVQFSSAGTAIAGAGLTKAGNTLDVVGTVNRITVAADSIDIASTYAGQTTITTLGTITTGVWNGTAIPVANGGTGSTTAPGARTNLASRVATTTARCTGRRRPS